MATFSGYNIPERGEGIGRFDDISGKQISGLRQFQAPSAAATFDIPTDIYSKSESVGSSRGSSSGSSFGRSTSWGGVNMQNPLVATMQPIFSRAVQNLPEDIENIGQQALGLSKAYTQFALGPQGLQGTLTQMAERGFFDDSMVADAISKAASNVMANLQMQTYEAGLDVARQKVGLPGQLAGMMEALGRESRAESESGSQQRSQQSSSQQSITEHPLEPYQLMANLLMNLPA